MTLLHTALIPWLTLACHTPGVGSDTASPALDTGCDCPEPVTFYADLDADGYGDPANSVQACDAPDGYVGNAADCDDADHEVNPDAVEVCNEVDDDCNGEVDDGAEDGTLWYLDDDGDGYGDPDSAVLSCDQPDGTVADGSDCDDADATVYPDAPELCDDQPNDCDGSWTDDAGTVTWFGADGTVSDLTSTWAAGADGAPAAWSSSDSGLLQICSGTWYASVNMSGDSVEVAGLGGPVVDGGLAARVLTLDNAVRASVHDLTVQRGSTSYSGGGIRVMGTGDVTLSNLVVQDSTTGQKGGGVAVDAGVATLTLDNVELIANEATTYGGGLYVDHVGAVAATNLTATGNLTAGHGAGLYFDTSPASLQTVHLSSNDADNAGGAAYVSGSPLTITGGTVSDNTMNQGGVYCASTAGSSLTISDVVFEDNTGSTGNGAGIMAANSTSSACESVTLTDVEIKGGTTGGYGAAIWDYATSSTYERVSIHDNSSRMPILLGGTSKEFVDSVITYNTSGEVVMYPTDGVDLTLTNTEVSNNTGGNGYGAIMVQQATVTCVGDPSSDTWGIWGNSSGYADGVRVANGTFVAIDCDMGDGVTTPDNDGTDVYVDPTAYTYTYGNDASFTCDSTSGTCY